MPVTLKTFFSIWVVSGITHTHRHTHMERESQRSHGKLNKMGSYPKKKKLSCEREICWEEKGRNGMGQIISHTRGKLKTFQWWEKGQR